jgi:hypothetical protein
MDPSTGKFWLCNDASVTPLGQELYSYLLIDKKKTVGTPYMLFAKRCTEAEEDAWLKERGTAFPSIVPPVHAGVSPSAPAGAGGGVSPAAPAGGGAPPSVPSGGVALAAPAAPVGGVSLMPLLPLQLVVASPLMPLLPLLLVVSPLLSPL